MLHPDPLQRAALEEHNAQAHRGLVRRDRQWLEKGHQLMTEIEDWMRQEEDLMDSEDEDEEEVEEEAED